MEYKEWKYYGPKVEGLLDQPTHCYFCESTEFEGVLRKFIHTPPGEYTALPVEPFVRYICDACWDFRRKTGRGCMFDRSYKPDSSSFRRMIKKRFVGSNKCSFCKNWALLYKERKKTYHCEQH